jgi:hypothetical protein
VRYPCDGRESLGTQDCQAGQHGLSRVMGRAENLVDPQAAVHAHHEVGERATDVYSNRKRIHFVCFRGLRVPILAHLWPHQAEHLACLPASCMAVDSRNWKACWTSAVWESSRDVIPMALGAKNYIHAPLRGSGTTLVAPECHEPELR